ncbi:MULTISPECIES: LysR substrate-binding domain-containing protein [Burkholderia]|uniref:LysR substrate-binding domain-containing protein n=1 Tax=Burkholderia TaxID=32008 RepID=UPI00158DD025|nr:MULTISPECIES: LysR substrate-binding domain-containing protein [Burkholderia]
MKVHQLRVLVACAEAGSLRGAADRLSLTHPAVTKTIRELEEEVRAPLLVRSAKGVELTRYGQALCNRARQILEDLRRAADEISQLQGGLTGKVSIGVSGSMALTAIPAALQQFRDTMPGVDIEISELPVEYLTASLLDGSLDFLVTHARVDARLDCEQTILCGGHLVVAVRNNHPATRVGVTSLADLTAFEWLFPKMIVDRHEFDALFARIGIAAPRRVVSCQSSMASLALVTDTDIVALFSVPFVRHPAVRDRVATFAFDDVLPEVAPSIVTRRDVQLTPAARHCRDIIRGVVEALPWSATAR